ncbi:hypothetical protein GCWU000342_01553 [Shuttleworthella satelles DSM 14600]|uniref:Uncharacterized protein n=1 Tax=Shuttleworthella satelles DSM 14600 TaxID=626523 RepID=C4GC66_9FIRM|nr:hypothetical protein GCWU000342_01553 [Shuttleworthia satelles DSM 14600]
MGSRLHELPAQAMGNLPKRLYWYLTCRPPDLKRKGHLQQDGCGLSPLAGSLSQNKG